MLNTYEKKLAELRAKPIIITGVTTEELGTIRAALNLYRTRNSEKHTDHPNMGWGQAAKTAEELNIRIFG